jgi:hypothetical protein
MSLTQLVDICIIMQWIGVRTPVILLIHLKGGPKKKVYMLIFYLIRTATKNLNDDWLDQKTQ